MQGKALNLIENVPVTDDEYSRVFEQLDFNFFDVDNSTDNTLDEILGILEVNQLSEVEPLLRPLNNRIQRSEKT